MEDHKELSALSTIYHIARNDTTSVFPVNIAGFISSLVLALPTNLYVIWLIVSGGRNKIAAEFFSLNLCVCEILLCLQSFVVLLSLAVPGLFLVVAILTGFFLTGRPLFQSLICVERYLAVVHPVTFLKFKPLRYKAICSAVAWITIVISCGIASLSVNPSQFYMFTLVCLCQAFFTFLIKLFCCVAVLRALKQSGPGERGREREEENHMKRRAFNIILIIIIAMVFIYAAYVLAAVSYLLTFKIIVTLWSFGHICFVLGGLVQPLLYLHRTRKLPTCKATWSSS